MASHRHFPKMGGIHFPYWLPGRDPVQLEIIRFKAGFFLLFCCDESDAFLSNYISSLIPPEFLFVAGSIIRYLIKKVHKGVAGGASAGEV